jgi:hypothetical protein
MDVQDPFRSKCICVNRCPEKKLDNIEDVKLFSTTTGSELCEYGIKPDDYPSQRRSKKGPCPVTPVLARYNSFLNFFKPLMSLLIN